MKECEYLVDKSFSGYFADFFEISSIFQSFRIHSFSWHFCPNYYIALKPIISRDKGQMSSFFWFFFGLILILGRFALLCSLYMLKTPVDEYLVENFNRFIWYTLYAEIGFAMGLSTLFFAASLILRGKGSKVLKIAAVILGALYIILSATDDELQRWMSQKLSLSFIKTYMFAFTDQTMVSKIFWGGFEHFMLTVGITLATITGISILAYKIDLKNLCAQRKKLITAICLTLIFAIVGGTSHKWFNPSPRRWDRIRPVVYSLIDDVKSSFDHQNMPAEYREGITLLGGNPDAEYPFWHEVENEKDSLEAFKSKPLQDKPDIILFTIESLRGWTSDMRVESNCKNFPNLCRFAKSGLYYPNTHSVGNPSVEGLLGIMTGVVSHPNSTLLRDYSNTNLRAFSEILADAGYYTEVAMGADPRFDNEEAWYSKWFNYYEFKPENANDVSSARRFIERYQQRPSDKPAFFHWMSLSMHPPFELPRDMGETPRDVAAAYMRSEVYMDSALGLILDSISRDPRFDNTLLILTGDHSIPNGMQAQAAERYGQANDGFTWISLIFAGPGITPRIDSRLVSQVNISKTIMTFLGLNVSNHFMGLDLINGDSALAEVPTIYSFRNSHMSMHEDSVGYYLINPVGGVEPAHSLKWNSEPAWDTTKPVEGFVLGAPVKLPDQMIQEKTAQMRAVAKAWDYLVYQNRIMPPPQP